MNDWYWVAQQEFEALVKNDTRILSLVRLARTQGDGRFRLQQYDKGLKLATQYKLLCWKLFFHRWIGEMLFYHQFVWQAK